MREGNLLVLFGVDASSLTLSKSWIRLLLWFCSMEVFLVWMGDCLHGEVRLSEDSSCEEDEDTFITE